MNKVSSTKKSFWSKKPEKMRVLFKNRSNLKETYEDIQRKFSLNQIIDCNQSID